MAKEPSKQPLLKDNGEPIVANDEEAVTVAEAVESDSEDLAETIREKGYVEALETISSIQEGLDALKQYLEDKE